MGPYHSRVDVTSRLRLRGFDYASAASYFVTVCVEQRVCLLGEIRDDDVTLSHAGVMVDSWWYSIPRRFPSIELDAMVVMPNHLHAVIHIGTDPEELAPPSLPDVMHWFKTRTTYDYTIGVRLEGWPRFPARLWQKRYYEHIVRNDRELERIRGYIESNPARWAEDRENPSAPR